MADLWSCTFAVRTSSSLWRQVFRSEKQVEWASHCRVPTGDVLHDAASIVPVCLKSLKELLVVGTEGQEASVHASNGVQEVRNLKEVDGDKALMAVLRSDVPIIYHVHRVVLDRVEDVFIGIPVEHDEVELGEFRQILVPRGPKRRQGSQRRKGVGRVCCLDQVGEG